MTKPAPRDLRRGGRGRRLWREVLADFDLTAAETLVLREAARILDRIDDLAAVVESAGLMAEGSAGQIVVHPAVAECRMQQAQLGRLLGQLGFERADKDQSNAGDGLLSLSSVRGSRAASARWARRTNAS